MSRMNRDQQQDFHRRLNQAFAKCVDYGGLPHDFCGEVTISLQFATVKRTKNTADLAELGVVGEATSVLSDERKARTGANV